MLTLAKMCAPFSVKSIDAKTRTFEGLASTWNQDLGGDVIHQGAFKRTLDNWRASKKALPLIDQHNYGSVRSVIGKLLDAQETDAGLEAKFEVIDGPDGEEVMRRIKGGFVDGLSIGYQAVKWEMETPDGADPWDAIRHLKEVKLYEVSVVIWPMNEEATIDLTTVKSFLRDAKGRQLTDEERAQMKAMQDQISALLADPAPPALAGLAPDDPQRIELDEMLRGLELRRLATSPR